MSWRRPVHGRGERFAYTVLYLAAWFVSTGLIVADSAIVYNVVLDGMTWISVHRTPESRTRELIAGDIFGWKVELVGQVMLLLLLCIGITLVICIEYYYRRAGDRRLLARRIAKVIGVQTVVALTGLLLQALI